jgi:hypothetical protein
MCWGISTHGRAVRQLADGDADAWIRRVHKAIGKSSRLRDKGRLVRRIPLKAGEGGYRVLNGKSFLTPWLPLV